jgi:hypothetical protein
MQLPYLQSKSKHAKTEKGHNPDIHRRVVAFLSIRLRLQCNEVFQAMPLPSAGTNQIRFIGSAKRPLRLLLSHTAPLATVLCLMQVGNVQSKFLSILYQICEHSVKTRYLMS